MSDRWRQRRKRCYEWLNRLDRDSKPEKRQEEMLRRVLGNSDENAKARECSSDQLDDTLHLKSYWTSKKSEPLIDVFEDKETVVVVAELIGIDKSNVDLHATQDKLTISVDSPECSYSREVELPTRVHVGSSSSKLKNGVLEIRLKKLSQELVVR